MLAVSFSLTGMSLFFCLLKKKFFKDFLLFSECGPKGDCPYSVVISTFSIPVISLLSYLYVEMRSGLLVLKAIINLGVSKIKLGKAFPFP